MTREERTRDLVRKQERAREMFLNIQRMMEETSDLSQLLAQLVEEYTKERREMFVAELDRLQKTWCTSCNEIVSVANTALILIEGAEMRQSTGGKQGWRCESFSEFHRACATCLERFIDRHGITGRTDRTSGVQECFHVFRVEDIAGEQYARKFGVSYLLEPHQCVLPDPAPFLVEKYARKLALPQAMGVKLIEVVMQEESFNFRRVKLMFPEEEEVAKAS